MAAIIFDSRLSVEKNEQLAKLVNAAREALELLKAEHSTFEAAGYGPNYAKEEEDALEDALRPFESMY